MGSSLRRRLAVDPLRPWLDSFIAEVEQLDDQPAPLAVVQAVVGAGANEVGTSVAGQDGLPPILGALVLRHDCPPGGWGNPWLPGLVHERTVSAAARQARGAWYTPRLLVEGLVRFIHESVDVPPFAVDATCGGGAFLLAVLDSWVERGVTPVEALNRVAGTDVDPDAVTVSRWALRLWAAGHGIVVDDDMIDVSVADALADNISQRWPSRRLAVGNPPFASPLKKGAIPEPAQQYRQRHADDLGQYADLAALHLHRCVSQLDPGSVVSLVLPQSMVSSRDVAAFRQRINETAATVGMWAAREAVFDAGVRTCAPVISIGRPQPETVRLATGSGVTPAGTSASDRWSTYAARCLGAPLLPPSVRRPAKTLSALCTATAGFRDEYYGLVAACQEWEGVGDPPNRLVTVGSIDPLTTSWGNVPVRFGGRRWNAPVIDVARLDDKVARWTNRQAKPKLVVATQSKLLEPLIDADGSLIPSTPLLAVHADADDLAAIAAVCLAPPVVAAAWQRWFGSALAVDALKLAAGQLGELPLPPDRKRWSQAADLIADRTANPTPNPTPNPTASPTAAGRWLDPEEADAVAAEVAALMNQAYRADRQVLQWWLKRAGR